MIFTTWFIYGLSIIWHLCSYGNGLLARPEPRCHVCDGVQSLEECSIANGDSERGRHGCLLQRYNLNGLIVYHGGPLEASKCIDIHRHTMNAESILPSHLGDLECQNCCHNDLCTSCGIPSTVSHTSPETTPYMLEKGLRCEVCSGGNCGVFTDADAIKQCPDHFPYCMNIVENDVGGDKFITKKCASENECETKWWKGSSNHPICINYDAADIYSATFSCTYCCVTEECNREFIPKTIRCTVCSGLNCGLFPRSYAIQQCPDHFPNCMNNVENDVEDKSDIFYSEESKEHPSDHASK